MVTQVLQSGVWSTTVPFAVNTINLASISPVSGSVGTSVTFTGSGFGATQGTGIVWLGSKAGQVLSWSDTTVVAAVASGAVTGIARIQQGTWSKAFSYTVPGSGSGSATMLTPNLLTMEVGDTGTVQALNAAGQPVTGLAWTSSDPTIVSLSADNPPVLTALAAGRVTILAGGASADVTVSASPLPVGTVLWSTAGSVDAIVPAVPSSTGVADVFALQSSAIQAITRDGTVAWTASVNCPYYSGSADFQGGFIVRCGQYSIYKLDGLTGQASPTYTNNSRMNNIAIHPDGTIFTVTQPLTGDPAVIGIDAATGAQKFSIPLEGVTATAGTSGFPIIAGDGYAYLHYATRDNCGNNCETNHLKLLRLNSSGSSNLMSILDWQSGIYDLVPFAAGMITNADTGVVLTIRTFDDGGSYTATITGTSVSLVSAQTLPGQEGPIFPYLQSQDGSFVGTAHDDQGSNFIVAFEGNGNIRWSVRADDGAAIATSDGGVIMYSGITYDQNGRATGQVGDLPTYSWLGNAYRVGSVVQLLASPLYYAVSWSAFQRGNPSGNGTATLRRDSKANERVKKILNSKRWQKFAKSHCAVVFGNAGQGLASMVPYYSLERARQKQDRTNFYDIGNPEVGALKLWEVTGRQVGPNPTLTAHLDTANGAAVNMGKVQQTAIIFKSIFLDVQPQFNLMHELLIHAYANQSDDGVFNNLYFQMQGLWRPANSSATSNLSTWLSTDCKCTPGNPATPNCQASSATW